MCIRDRTKGAEEVKRMRRINLFSYGMMSLLKLFARVLVIVLAVSLFQQARSAPVSYTHL